MEWKTEKEAKDERFYENSTHEELVGFIRSERASREKVLNIMCVIFCVTVISFASLCGLALMHAEGMVTKDTAEALTGEVCNGQGYGDFVSMRAYTEGYVVVDCVNGTINIER